LKDPVYNQWRSGDRARGVPFERRRVDDPAPAPAAPEWTPLVKVAFTTGPAI
jgi:hypothetical protein